MVHREGWTIPDMQNNSPLEDSELEPEVSYLSLKVTIYSLVVFFPARASGRCDVPSEMMSCIT